MARATSKSHSSGQPKKYQICNPILWKFPNRKKLFQIPIGKILFWPYHSYGNCDGSWFLQQRNPIVYRLLFVRINRYSCFVFYQKYGISTACLGNLLYLTAKLSRQIHDVTLTSERIPFYRNSLLFGLMASSFIAFKIPELLLIELTPTGYLFIGLIAGLLIDILNLIFKE